MQVGSSVHMQLARKQIVFYEKAPPCLIVQDLRIQVQVSFCPRDATVYEWGSYEYFPYVHKLLRHSHFHVNLIMNVSRPWQNFLLLVTNFHKKAQIFSPCSIHDISSSINKWYLVYFIEDAEQIIKNFLFKIFENFQINCENFWIGWNDFFACSANSVLVFAVCISCRHFLLIILPWLLEAAWLCRFGSVVKLPSDVLEYVLIMLCWAILIEYIEAKLLQWPGCP